MWLGALSPTNGGESGARYSSLMPFLDQSRWPIVSCRYPEHVSDEFVDQLGEELIALVKSSRRFGLLIDATVARPLTPKQRSRIVASVEANEALFKACCVGQAVVMHSTMARGVLTALSWLKKPPFPLKTFDTVDAAEAWLRTSL